MYRNPFSHSGRAQRTTAQFRETGKQVGQQCPARMPHCPLGQLGGAQNIPAQFGGGAKDSPKREANTVHIHPAHWVTV